MNGGSNASNADMSPEKKEKPKRICASTVKSLYCLKPDDLDNIPHTHVSNPHYRCAPQMRLYDEDDVILYVHQINDPVFKKKKELEHQKNLEARQQKRSEQKNVQLREKENKAKMTLQRASQLYAHAQKIHSQMDRARARASNENENENENDELILPDLPDDILRKIAGHLIDDVRYHGIYGPDMAAQDCASLALTSKKLEDMACTGYNLLYENIIANNNVGIFSHLISRASPFEMELRSMLCGQEMKTFTKRKLIDIARDLGVSGYTIMNKDVLCVEILTRVFEPYLDSLWVNSSSVSSEIPFLLPYINLTISKTSTNRVYNMNTNELLKTPDAICPINVIGSKLNILDNKRMNLKELRKALFHVHGFKQELTYDMVHQKYKALEEKRHRHQVEQIRLHREELRLKQEKLDIARNEYFAFVMKEFENGKKIEKKTRSNGTPICRGIEGIQYGKGIQGIQGIQGIPCNNTPSPSCTLHCCQNCCRNFSSHIIKMKGAPNASSQGSQGSQGTRYICARHLQ